MMNLKMLWQLRLHQFGVMLSRYGKLILNDHFAVIIVLIFGFGGVYYQQQLMGLQAIAHYQLHIGVISVAALLWWVLLRSGSPILLMKEPDKSYLFARGHEWHPIWLRGVMLGMVLPMLLISASTLLVMPFISLVTPWQLGDVSWLILSLVLFKAALDMLAYLDFYQMQTRKVTILRYQPYVALGIILLVLMGIHLPVRWGVPWLLVGLVGLFGVIVYRLRQLSNATIQFEALIESEQKREVRLYRWLAIFAEVPHQAPVIKRRRWLDGLVSWLSNKLGDRYSYLYVRLLSRHTAYSGILVRVTLFISVLLLGAQQAWLMVGLGMVGVLLTFVQLLPLYQMPLMAPLQSLYVVPKTTMMRAFQQTIGSVLLLQWGVLTGVLLLNATEWSWKGIASVSWLVLVIGLVVAYIPYWVKKYATI